MRAKEVIVGLEWQNMNKQGGQLRLSVPSEGARVQLFDKQIGYQDDARARYRANWWVPERLRNQALLQLNARLYRDYLESL